MFFKKVDFWECHKVRRIGASYCRVEFVSDTFVTPTLDYFIREEKISFPERDLKARKTGVVGYRRDGAELVLQCVPVSWAQYVVGTKVRSELPLRERFHRLAGSCCIVTGDGYHILSFRSKRAERYPDVWHVGAAGYIEPSDIHNGSADAGMLRELEEEVNLPNSQITSFEQIGVCEHAINPIYEICFRARTLRTASDILRAAEHAIDASEGKLSARSPRKVKKLLKRETFNPAGAATLLIHFGL